MKHEEDNIQRAVIKYLRLRYPKVVYMAIPNGGYRSKTEAAIMSGLGVVAGAPDIFIAKPGWFSSELTASHGLFLELKSPKGRLSENQKNMIKKLTAAGYACEVAYGLDEAIEKIKNYLG